jgi:Cu(I)/Ag(I) efflux system membrane fusion protein
MKSLRTILPWLITALFAVAFVVVLVGRRTTERGKSAADAGRAQPSPVPPVSTPARKILYWIDPMTPGYKSDKPGKSPFMDMDLVPVYEEAAADAPQGKPVAGYSTIWVPPERQQAIGVQLGKVELRDLTKTIRAVGRVTFDETLLLQVHAKLEG